MYTRKAVSNKTFQVGALTAVSRILGIVREIGMTRYIGASALSDAFFMAYKVPNTLRKVFAEGALSTTLVPFLVDKVRGGERVAANNFMAIALLTIEGFFLVVTAVTMLFAEQIIGCIAWGFSPELREISATFLRIIMPFVVCISMSGLLAGPLQAVGNFFAPAVSPIILNLIFIISIVLCKLANYPVSVLCYGIIVGGAVQLFMHIYAYHRAGFSLGRVSWPDVRAFSGVVYSFFPSLLCISIVEINFFIDVSFASTLSSGSVTLLHYGSRFMAIPLGVFSVAFSSVLLPYVTHVGSSPRRIGFFMLEATKFIAWTTIPATLLMIFFSRDIFETLFVSNKFSLAQAVEAADILQIYLLGLPFLAINRVILSLYLAMHQPWLPAAIGLMGSFGNIVLNSILIRWFGTCGLAWATVITSIVQMGALVAVLHYGFAMPLYVRQLMRFITRYSLLLGVVTPVFYAGYYCCVFGASLLLPTPTYVLFLKSALLWLWVLPLWYGAIKAVRFLCYRWDLSLYFADN